MFNKLHCSICSGGINYYPPTKVIITVGDMADEEAKGAVRLSLSTNLGKSWRELKLPVPEVPFTEPQMGDRPGPNSR